MHLGGRQEFSTFRRTLAAILCTAVNNADETALTEWMMKHLRVVAVPYEDADSLGRLESDVLTALNPALNLQGMPDIPVRLLDQRDAEGRRAVSENGRSAAMRVGRRSSYVRASSRPLWWRTATSTKRMIMRSGLTFGCRRGARSTAKTRRYAGRERAARRLLLGDVRLVTGDQIGNRVDAESAERRGSLRDSDRL